MAHVENPDDFYGGPKDPRTNKWHRTENSYSFPMPEFKYVGLRHLGRPDIPEKVSGMGIFGRDVNLAGMLYAKGLRSPYAKANILSMDTSKAEALPGVRYVLRYDDPEWGESLTANPGVSTRPQCNSLCDYTDREGQEMGVVVAADTMQICDEALKLVEVVWEEQTPLVDWDDYPEEAMYRERVEEWGDLDAGFAEADRIVEGKIKRNNTVCSGGEALVCTASWRGDRYLDVWPLNQYPHATQQYLTTWWPSCRINTHAPFHGSQFGSWNWSGGIYQKFPLVACILAKLTGRPVKHYRDGSFFDGGSQCDGTLSWKIGMKEDGTITAIDWTVLLPHGSAGLWLHETTKIKNARCTRLYIDVQQGRHPCWKHGGAYVIYEALTMEIVSGELGMDPLEVRKINDGSLEHDRAWVEDFMDEYGFDSSRNSLLECMDAVKQSIDWDNKWTPAGTNILPNGKYHGMGFSCSEMWTHVMGDKGGSYVGLGFRPDGTLQVLCLRGDQGTGWQGSAVRAAADEMGMLYEDVDIEHHEQAFFHAHDEGCGGGTITIVSAITKAARKLKQWVLEAATFDDETTYVIRSHGARYTHLQSVFADKTAAEMDIKDSVVFEKANPENQAPLRDVVRTIDTGTFGGEHRRPLFDWGWSRNIDPVLNPDVFLDVHGWPCMVRQIQVCEVEVDPETGLVELIQAAGASDVGKACDPDAVDQQIFGGYTMGVSRTLMEELCYDPLTGIQLSDNLISYPIAVMNDSALAEPFIIETGGGYGPYGATGCGEVSGANGQCLIPTAVHNAIGKWVDTPCTPMRILKALGKV